MYSLASQTTTQKIEQLKTASHKGMQKLGIFIEGATTLTLFLFFMEGGGLELKWS